MVRNCVVADCQNKDITTLCHRFPRSREALQKWIDSLNLNNMDPATLMANYVVCTKHFKASDYRNEQSTRINTTAIPTLNENRQEKRVESGLDPSSVRPEAVERILKVVEKAPITISRVESPQLHLIDLPLGVHIQLTDEPPAKRPRKDVEVHKIVRSKVVKNTQIGEGNQNNEIEQEKVEQPVIWDSVSEIDEEISKKLTEKPETIIQKNVQLKKDAPLVIDVKRFKNSSTQTDQDIKPEPPEFADKSRHELIKDLVQERKKVTELEEKLSKLSAAHEEMMRSLENFKKLFNS